jgi:hypothetical protein
MGISTSGDSRKFILSAAAGGVEGLDANGRGEADQNHYLNAKSGQATGASPDANW